MEKILKYIPLTLFVAYTVKVGVIGAEYVDAPVMLILSMISAFYEVKPSYQKVSEIESKIDEMSKEIKEIQKDHDELQTHVAGLKMSKASFRSVR